MNTTNSKASFSHIYINLYQSVGDKNKNNGLETQFLLDTGASSSIFNYHTYTELCKTQHIEMKASKNHTLAVNGEKLKLLGQKTFKTSFDIEGKYQVEITAWVSAKDGCKPNLLGMDFLESTVKSIDISTPKIDLKTYPEVAVKLSRYQNQKLPVC